MSKLSENKLVRIFKKSRNGMVLDYAKAKPASEAKAETPPVKVQKPPTPVKADFSKSKIKEFAALPANYTTKQFLEAADKVNKRLAGDLPGVPGAKGSEPTDSPNKQDGFETGSGFADESQTERIDTRLYYIKAGDYYLMYKDGKVWINSMNHSHWCWLKRLDADSYGNQSWADYSDFKEIKKEKYTIQELMLRCQIYKPDDWDIKNPKNSITENAKAVKAYREMNLLVDYGKATKI